MLTIVLAYAAGLLTLINPCVLPLLPLIAAGAVGRHRLGPAAMAVGLAAGFTLSGMSIYWLTRATGLAQSDVALIGGLAMIGFGAVLLMPQAEAGFSRLAGAMAGSGTRLVSRVEGKGLGGEMLAGALLGVAWSPCIGPTLGGAIGLAAQGEDLAGALAVMLAFSAGTATVLLALAYGARALLARRRELLGRLVPHAKRILGIGLFVVGLIIVFHIDRLVERWAVETLPSWFTEASISL